MLISEAFLNYRAAEIIPAGKSLKTEENYKYTGKHAVDFFGDKPIEQVTIEEVRKFYDYLRSWQRPDTVRGHMMCLRKVIKYYHRKEFNVLDPEDIKIPQREKREVVYLEKEEVEKFVEEVARKRRGYSQINRVRNIAIAKLLFVSGIRVGELCRMNRNSIKNGQFIAIGKSKYPRPCYINNDTQQAIAKYLAMRSDRDQALFVSNQNGRRITPGGVQRIFKRVCNISDFEGVHPHTMRHSFASYMLDQEVDISYVGKLLGHCNLSTTQMYTHYKDKKLQNIHAAVMQS